MPPMRVLAPFAFLALTVTLALVGCNDKRVHCTGWSGSEGNLLSVGSLTSCTDNKTRDVRCARNSADAPYKCSCIEGGTVGKSFQQTTPLPGSADALTKLAVQECGWALK